MQTDRRQTDRRIVNCWTPACPAPTQRINLVGPGADEIIWADWDGIRAPGTQSGCPLGRPPADLPPRSISEGQTNSSHSMFAPNERKLSSLLWEG